MDIPNRAARRKAHYYLPVAEVIVREHVIFPRFVRRNVVKAFTGILNHNYTKNRKRRSKIARLLAPYGAVIQP